MIRYTSSELVDMLTDSTNLLPHPANPNNGDVEEIVASILTIGCYRPIYASVSTGHIVGGHHLYEALLTLGEHRVPVIWGEYTPEEELRALAADNAIAKKARMDPGLEYALVKELMGTDQGLVGSGYNEWDAERLRLELAHPYGPGALGIEEEPPMGVAHTCPNCGHEFVEGS